ncbi:MAG: TIGR04255 family protein [Bryobacterales bacterium]|nr:TIGR04255 family protein [Bryobacterales bacterium]
MKRSLPPLRLSRSPLVYVVLQVRTSAVVSLEQYVPRIQDSLRRSGFPKFTKSKIHEIRFQVDTEPVAATSDRFEFQSRNGRTGIVLTANTWALHTSEYSHFEDFLASFEKMYQTVNPVLELDFAERIGLRYVDLVRLEAGETFDRYMTPSILGPEPSQFGMNAPLSRFEMVGTTEGGTLALRHWQMNTGAFLPPDLLPSTLTHPTELEAGETVSLLDFDHYSTSQFDFELGQIQDRAWRLHDNLDRCFRKVVTPFAQERWGGKAEG